MAHELDGTDGTTFFADSRTDAWHGLGQPVGHLMTAQEVMAESHLANWNVRKEPLFAAVKRTGWDDPEMVLVEDRFATVRTNPITGAPETLGVVGKGYHVIQNEETADMLNALVDESGAHFETAGALRGGRETFVTMKLPHAMVLDLPSGQDRTDLYIAALNSHDGWGALNLIVTPVRIVCANTQCAALANAQSKWSIRHTSGAANAIALARESLKLTWRYLDEFEEQVQSMAAAEIEREQAERLLRQVFKANESETTRQYDNRAAHVTAVLEGLNAPTNAMLGQTRYGVYNALTEYVDHRWPVRGGDGATGVAPEKALRGSYADLKARAFELLSV